MNPWACGMWLGVEGETPNSLPKCTNGKPYLESHEKNGQYDKDEFQTTLPKTARRSEVEEPKQNPNRKWYETPYESSNPSPACHMSPSQWHITLTL